MRRPTEEKTAWSPSIYSTDWATRPSLAFAAVCKWKDVEKELKTTSYLSLLTARAEQDRNATKLMIRQLLEKSKKAEVRAGSSRERGMRKKETAKKVLARQEEDE